MRSSSMHARLMTTSVLALALCVSAQATAQDKKEDAKATIPLKVQIVISRFDGDNKKISSMPYVLSVTAGKTANMRMGTAVPVLSTSYTPIAAGGASVNPLTSYQYK